MIPLDKYPKFMQGCLQRQKNTGCVLFLGTLYASGYGRVSSNYNGEEYAHRCVWVYFRGKIPNGLEINHKCFVRNCVRLKHLELMTHKENTQYKIAKTHCIVGHEFSEENTYINSKGVKICKQCKRESNNRSRNRHR